MTTMHDEVERALTEGRGSVALTPFPGLTAEAVARMRRLYDDLVPTRETLDVLFAVDAAQTAPTEEWSAFFVQIASAHVLWDQRPTGVLNETDAHFLMARFDEAPTLAVLSLLVDILEEAHRIPTWFAAAVRHRASLFNATSMAGRKARREVPYLRLVA